jgi:hypothetical protein
MEIGNILPDTYTTTLQRDVLRTLLYFDIFHHPLRLREIYRYLPSNSVSLEDVRKACQSDPLDGFLSQKRDFYFLGGQSTDVINDRTQKERRARQMWKIAVLISHVIRRFPFVRGVFVSGELSKGVASKDSDIDFFIVTARNRVWITRTLFTLFKKTVLLNSRKFFCYNHITSEDHLEITQRNIYTAIELVTLRPIYGVELHKRLMNINSWTKEFLPNCSPSRRIASPSPTIRPLSEKVTAWMLSATVLDSLDSWLCMRWKEIWDRRYPQLTSEKRRQLFHCGKHVSTAYVNDFLDRIVPEYNRRLRQHGLAPVDSTL